jgi:uncharacterized membrane protein YhaH (DUF805 family)
MPRPVNSGGPRSPRPSTDDLDLPLYGATFGEAVKRFFLKYGIFEGRASRSEYWWAMLLNVLIWSICFALIAAGGTSIFDSDSELTEASGPGLLLLLTYSLVTLLPNWALGTRRLHDINDDSAYLFGMSPAALFLAMRPSNPEGVRFDRNWTEPTDEPKP